MDEGWRSTNSLALVSYGHPIPLKMREPLSEGVNKYYENSLPCD